MRECYDEIITFVESELMEIEKEAKAYERIRNLKNIEDKAQTLAKALKNVGYEFPTEEQYKETYKKMEELQAKKSILLEIKETLLK